MIPFDNQPCSSHGKSGLQLVGSFGRQRETGEDRDVASAGCCLLISCIFTGDESCYLANGESAQEYEWVRQNGFISFAGYQLHDLQGKICGVLVFGAERRIPAGKHLFFENFSHFISQVVQAQVQEYISKKEKNERCRLERDFEKAQAKIDKLIGQEGNEALQSFSALHRVQKMDALGLMAGGVAHELNNILSGVVSYPDLLLRQIPAESPFRKSIQSIRDCGMRAAEMVDDLLTVARSESSGIKEVADLNKLVQDFLLSEKYRESVIDLTHIFIETDFEPCLPRITCSAGQIQKIIRSLFVNASQALVDKAGKVVLATSYRYLDRPLRGYETIRPGEYVVLTVSDTGGEMNVTDIDRIFEPFYIKKTMKRRGGGLGLSVAWNIVKAHGGSIDVICSSKGTCFEIYFPAMLEKNTGFKDSSQNGKNEQGRYTVLVVDDELIQLELAKSMLEELGYRVITVPSGEKAIEVVQSQGVDLVILDMIMDPGMNGRQTLEGIRKVNPQQAAIIASGFAEKSEMKKVQQLGVGTLLKKPYTLEQLGKAVRLEIAKKRRTSPFHLELYVSPAKKAAS
ncbi:MAG: response regulator [Desulfobulbaceae bacterium]|nr:response regulator [Desulfobulbaceae bacterium]